MYTAILIDDEKNALEMLEWQLQKYFPQIKVMALCSSADEGITAIKKHKPNLVFLDIEMPVKNGFEVLNAFTEPTFKVIFTTAYNQFAIKAFKVAAFDYLLKPIDIDDLKNTIERFIRSGTNALANADQLKELFNQYNSAVNPGRIALHTSDGLLMVKPEAVIRCQSISNYTKIFLENNAPLVVTKTLKEVEELLGNTFFFRIHNSHLVNLNHITNYKKLDGGVVVMSDGEQLAVARNRKEEFMANFSKI